MLGDGFLWQVVLKFTRVHHPKVPRHYLRKTMGKHLIVGASGQLGIELMLGLQQRYGADVVLADLRPSPHPEAAKSMFIAYDATDLDAQRAILERHDVDVMYNLVAMLSAKGEANPMAAWALEHGPFASHPRTRTGRTGEARVLAELHCCVWVRRAQRYDAPRRRLVPPRSTACPKRRENCGANTTTTSLGWTSEASGTWAHRVSIHAGRRNDGLCGGRLPLCPSRNALTCYLDENERLPMMSMDDAVRGTMELMEAPSESINIRTSYNLQWVRFLPGRIDPRLAATRASVRHGVRPRPPARHRRFLAQQLGRPRGSQRLGLARVTTLDGLVDHMMKAWRNNPTLTSRSRTCDWDWFGLYFRVLNLKEEPWTPCTSATA